MRSQIFAKTLPMPLVVGALKRLDLLRTQPELKDNLWTVVRALQSGLREKGFNIGTTQSPVTPVLLAGQIPDATALTFDLRENHGIFCSIVVYPVVPKDVIMLRLIPTAGAYPSRRGRKRLQPSRRSLPSSTKAFTAKPAEAQPQVA